MSDRQISANIEIGSFVHLAGCPEVGYVEDEMQHGRSRQFLVSWSDRKSIHSANDLVFVYCGVSGPTGNNPAPFPDFFPVKFKVGETLFAIGDNDRVQGTVSRIVVTKERDGITDRIAYWIAWADSRLTRCVDYELSRNGLPEQRKCEVAT